jgi:hypothetical protein
MIEALVDGSRGGNWMVEDVAELQSYQRASGVLLSRAQRSGWLDVNCFLVELEAL